ncbi:hypothetical protein [Rhodoferax sp. OV413]|uniref:Ig-like domain-containing protein n=1 Tax=Rhodoferax sp. OV413 TaxID=1855285 RepID=UPI0015A29A51|nr:hypothetical protein [Rhodoferax sp. OV413]
MTLAVLNGSGVSSTNISTAEIATAKVTLLNSSGAPIQGVIVNFTGGGLLTLAPTSATALTDANGQASVEIRASSSTSTGATLVSASAAVIVSSTSTTVTAQKAISISSAPSSGASDPQLLANALNFLDTNPSDKSIVLKGSGGNGRSESATLRFRVVDTNNAPVKGTIVDFSVNPSSVVTLNIASATSDTDGVVVATVSSGTVATSVVVTATVRGRSIASQSDQLLVTTGSAIAAGFDLSASKFNLNASLSGDSSTITVRIRDANGNPVADGVPVVFTTDFGGVGSSAQGGCLTSNGLCTVTYTVQDPRPADGQLVTVVSSTQVGSTGVISKSINLSAVSPGALGIYSAKVSGTKVTALNLGTVCSAVFSYYVGTPLNFAAAAGTTVGMTGQVAGLSGSVSIGSPILDALTFGERTAISFTVTAPSTAGAVPACVAGGSSSQTVNLLVTFTSPGTTPVQQTMPVTYPF